MTFGFYAVQVGRPGSSMFTPRKDYALTVEARHEADALTQLASILDVPRAMPMARSLPVLGVGTIKAERRS